MCVYCNCGDWAWKHDPPFYPKPSPLLPSPAVWPQPQPFSPWNIEKLKEYKKLLEDIKALEDSIGCPCTPNKADHIQVLQDRINVLTTASDGTTSTVTITCPCGPNCNCNGTCMCGKGK